MTPTRLTALASAASGDPTPFEGLVSVPARILRMEATKKPPVGVYATAREAGLALADALRDFVGKPQVVLQFRRKA